MLLFAEKAIFNLIKSGIFVEFTGRIILLNSKLIDILKTFSQEEIKKFSEFLISPFHNKNKKAVQLFEFLSAFHPEYENKNLTKEKIFEKIFSGKSKSSVYNDASVRNLLSDLMILAEKFTAYLNFENERFYFNERILRKLSLSKLTGVFEKRLKLTEDIFSGSEFHGEEEYYQKYILEELKGSSSQFSDNLKLYKTDYSIRSLEYLTYYYLIKIFKSVNFIGYQKQFNIDNTLNISEYLLGGININEVLESVKNKSERDYLILSIYHKLYLSLKNPDNDDYYFKFKDIVTANDQIFSELEKYGLYVSLTNNCVQKIDLGKDKFFKECFEIYKIMFRKNLLAIYPGYFPMTTFTAVIQTGLASDETDTVEKFISDYSDKLNPAHRDDAVNYAYAQLSYYRKEFGKALEYISKTDSEFSQFKYHLKTLSLKIFFETGDYDSLYYTSDSFIHFLGKNKLVSSNYKTEFGNFVKIIDLLVKFKLSPDDNTGLKIEEMLDKKPAAGKKWLREKYAEALNNR